MVGDGLFRGMRARLTAVTMLVTLVSMTVLTGGVALGVWHTISASTKAFLAERLEGAEAAVRRGDLDAAVDVTGPVVLQVIDGDGRVLVSSVDAISHLPIVDVARDADLDLDDFVPDDDDVDEASGEARGVSSGESEGAPAASGGGSDWSDRAERDDDPGDEHEGDSVGDLDDDDGSDDLDDDDDDLDDDEGDYDDDDDYDEDGAKLIVWHGRTTAHAISLALGAGKGGNAEPSDTLIGTLSEAAGLEGPYITGIRRPRYLGSEVTIVAVASLASALEAARSAAVLLGVTSVFVLLGAGAFTWWMVGRTLRPVEEMRASTASIVDANPSDRLAVPEQDRDLKELAATFNDLLARAEQALVEQRRFVSDASHQLKSPVAAQRVMIETLRTHPDALDSDRVLDDLARENGRLQGIVDDLLALARHDEGQMPSRLQVDLIDVLYEEIASASAHASVLVDAGPIEPVVVRGDARLLGQAVRNLLDNALRYAKSAVHVSCVETDRCARIVVSDDGPGIPAQDRERVFERFVRLEEGRLAERSSTGLGLAVVRGIVEDHGGRVWFEESPKGGAAAIIELPLDECIP